MPRIKFFKRTSNSALLRLLTYGFITILIVIISSSVMSLRISAIAQPTVSPNTQPKSEQPALAKKPNTCSVGAYLISLYDFDLANKSFGADFWLWSTCPSADLQPLKVMDIVNGKDVKTSLDNTFRRQNSYWSVVVAKSIG